MGKRFKPSGVGHWNSNTTQLLVDPNFDLLFSGTNLYLVESADPNADAVEAFQVLLVEAVAGDYDWWQYEYDTLEEVWTEIGSGTGEDIATVKELIRNMSTYAMNSPVTDAEVITIKALIGIV